MRALIAILLGGCMVQPFRTSASTPAATTASPSPSRSGQPGEPDDPLARPRIEEEARAENRQAGFERDEAFKKSLIGKRTSDAIALVKQQRPTWEVQVRIATNGHETEDGVRCTEGIVCDMNFLDLHGPENNPLVLVSGGPPDRGAVPPPP